MSTAIPASAVTAVRHRIVSARARAVVLSRGRHLKDASAQLDEADRLTEVLEHLLTPADPATAATQEGSTDGEPR